MGEDFPDWAARVTLVVTFDPATDTLVVDRGVLPRMFAVSILTALGEGDFMFTDEEPDYSDHED